MTHRQNGSAEPGPSREDRELSRVCECGRQMQPDLKDPLEKAPARQNHAKHGCLSEQGCHSPLGWGKWGTGLGGGCNSLTL